MSIFICDGRFFIEEFLFLVIVEKVFLLFGIFEFFDFLDFLFRLLCKIIGCVFDEFFGFNVMCFFGVCVGDVVFWFFWWLSFVYVEGSRVRGVFERSCDGFKVLDVVCFGLCIG